MNQDINQKTNQAAASRPSREQEKEQLKKEYNEYVKQITPVNNAALDMAKAFLTGGLICCAGQGLLHWIQAAFGQDKQSAGLWMLLILIAASIILTGFGLFSRIARFAGAGVLVPITGFANSVASPAIEYKSEGQVFGIGCKIFTIAGPVILYGVFASWALGILYWLLRMWGIMG